MNDKINIVKNNNNSTFNYTYDNLDEIFQEKMVDSYKSI